METLIHTTITASHEYGELPKGDELSRFYVAFPIEDAPADYREWRIAKGNARGSGDVFASASSTTRPLVTDKSKNYDAIQKAFNIAKLRNFPEYKILTGVPASLKIRQTSWNKLEILEIVIDSDDLIKSVTN